MRPALVILIATFSLVALPSGTSRAEIPGRFVLQQDIVRDVNAPPGQVDLFLDTTLHLLWPRAHAALTVGSFDVGAEVGGYWKDGRGSAYGATLRRRGGGRVHNTSFELDTQQKLGRTVLGTFVRFFWPDRSATEPLLLVPGGSFEVYYGAESFAGLRVTSDPRAGTGTTFRFVNRLVRGPASLDVSLAPRTDGVVNSSVMARWRVFYAGFAAENDYDFTPVDRHLWFFGFQHDLRP
jgi:hypothetical protein